MPQLTPAEIADRDARRLGLVLRDIGGEVAPVGGGWMACDLPGSWADYAAGLGVGQPVDGADLDALVAFYRARGRPPRIQVTPYQHATLHSGLAARGFSPYDQTVMLACSLDDLAPVSDMSGLRFRRVDPARNEDIAAFRDSQMIGHYSRAEPPAGILPITERVVKHDRAEVWLFELDGQIVGSGGLEIFEDSGTLIGGCTYPEYRRQGLQSAFIRFRLQRAASLGLRYAVVGSVPGEATERNAERAGFSVVYTQVALEQP